MGQSQEAVSARKCLACGHGHGQPSDARWVRLNGDLRGERAAHGASRRYRSRDLTSYSLGNIVLANVGNTVHSIYVFSLPPGPVWLLHSFYVVTQRADVGVVPPLHVAEIHPCDRPRDGWIARRGAADGGLLASPYAG